MTEMNKMTENNKMTDNPSEPQMSNLKIDGASEQDVETQMNGNVISQNTSHQDYLPWQDYFMGLCFLTAARSKDPNRKVGACIVDKMNRVVSLGYNGMPRGINDKDLPWVKFAEHNYETKYPYVCHAEMNAVVNCRANLEDCSLFVSKFPCCECAKVIIQSGIKQVIFSEHHQGPIEEQVPTRKMFRLAGVICKEFISSVHHLSLNMVDGKGSVTISK